MAGSRAMRVPKAVGERWRNACISSANGKTGNRIARPAAVASTVGVRCPEACGTPRNAAVAAAMGTVRERPVMPLKRPPIC